MKLMAKKLSSLDKVFLDREPVPTCEPIGTALRNEPFSFQIAWYAESEEDGFSALTIGVAAADDYGGTVRLYEIGHVPSELPAYPQSDDDFITKQPGLFPDPLYEVSHGTLRLVACQWRSLWVEFDPRGGLPAGKYAIRVEFRDPDGRELASVEHTVELLNAELPKQELIHTEWFHYDGIAAWYRIEAFGERYWELLEHYIETAVEHGMNMLLTPLFTPPLDTKVGGERLTTQLIKVTEASDGYIFDFSSLKRFIDMSRQAGIEYFEMSHLFTQWGAKAATKIMAETKAGQRQIFGWDTEATGPAYISFLENFLPQLVRNLREWGIAEKCWFHISDEPNMSQLDTYGAALKIVQPHLLGFRMLDALSEYAFYEEGLVQTPVPASNHIDPFLEGQVSRLWTYYCCAQDKGVSNRFMAMPSRRNRIIAGQLYKYRMEGFLHWGYNFWNAQFSLKPINPYAVTDAGCAFPSGDAFLVYPGEDGRPVTSIRLKVMREALNDLRAMQLLERIASRELVLDILEDGGRCPLTFSDYPREESALIHIRSRINAEIAARIDLIAT
ncbi:DUF4091 domain-containing protein [Paenibacillus sp. 2TAB23]|uniref:DUF4091 domain-containing protein n=1 Tax=Paenibacillus sp. 2TAB23 TaxID=3233004 RepID=UPI003F988BD1